MSRRAPSRPSPRAVVRTSQRSRSEPQAFVRAYELALPVLCEALAAQRLAKESAASPQSRHFVPQTLCGG
jgi:hypothetical protein